MRIPARRISWLILVVLTMLAIWLLNVSRPGRSATGCPQGCALVEPAGDGRLRVLSLNVLHGHPDFQYLSQRMDLIAAEIRQRRVDIALLQEVPWTGQLGPGAAYLAEKTGMNYLYQRANGNRWAIFFEEGEAILSRYPLKDPQVAELKPQAAFFEHRVVLRAVAVTPHGDLGLYVTHLTNGSGEVHQLQVAALQDFVTGTRQGPALVAGDFNALEDETQMLALSRLWSDTYRDVHPDRPGATCCVDPLAGVPGENLQQRIDYVYLVPGGDPRLTVQQAEVVLDQPFAVEDGWLWASDHAGVLVTLEVAGE